MKAVPLCVQREEAAFEEVEARSAEIQSDVEANRDSLADMCDRASRQRESPASRPEAGPHLRELDARIADFKP